MDYKQKNANRKAGKKNGNLRQRQEARTERKLCFTNGAYRTPGAFGEVKAEIFNEMIFGTTAKPRR